MVNFVKNIFIRIFYKMGFLPPERILPPLRLYNYFQFLEIPVQNYKLKELTDYISKVEDQKYYESLLSQFVPNWNPTAIKDKKFIENSGRGRSSLNSYRKGTRNGKVLFEKVYLNSYPDIRNVEWFYEKLFPKINNNIKIPNLLNVCKGKLISIVDYEYLDLIPFPSDKIESKLISISSELYSLSNLNEIKGVIENAPNDLKDFKNYSYYRIWRDNARERMQNEGLDFQSLEYLVASSKRVITHGDLQSENLFLDNTLIDWDYFGLYPMGMEQAFLYFLKKGKNRNEKEISNWLKDNYGTLILNEDWERFRTNFIFFLYVFIQSKKDDFIELKKELLEFLKQRI